MSNLEAAYHEASHAVLAEKSCFHRVVKAINISKHGTGECPVSLSKEKVEACGKEVHSGISSDVEVTEDLVVILCGGYVGEWYAQEQYDGITADINSASNDHERAELMLSNAHINHDLDHYREFAGQILSQDWDKVEKLARYLINHGSIEPWDIPGVINA
ncbi:TPA: hypothetical protein ACX3A9_004549 [Vibrio parahaemolyticus]|uniref:hypothetical protein n=1 Tax=Vibrio TaxID=662 RepID=UPI00111E5768|nr:MULTISPECIES: hypothetical protein [Vibrio]ELK8586320.1 hypothetical protein [Vibrio vulnificus]MCA3966925.1 hypothetical protein [Vibrio vulnificus]MCA4019842.1 hypothetical protein [Vibrio vulnificus]MDS1805662.1 hypothetical protein [Vibrio vulnificus]TOG81847.1 hypothetical protein CGI95_23565 [Vibrio parahaemolyticus]